jgi:hypothetical protein
MKEFAALPEIHRNSPEVIILKQQEKWNLVSILDVIRL